MELYIEYKILNDHEIHNSIGRIKKKKITCSSTMELEGLIQTKFYLDKGQKYLLQEYDKKENLFFDVADISEVEDGARNSCQPQKMGVSNDIDIESSTTNEIGCDNDDEMDVRSFIFLSIWRDLKKYFYKFYCWQK